MAIQSLIDIAAKVEGFRFSPFEEIPLLPESEGQNSEAITSTETSGFPARQSGSPEVDPSGERQFDSFGLPIVKVYPPMPPVKQPRMDDP